MEMYKNPRSESNIIHRLQKLGFRETMGYTDGFVPTNETGQECNDTRQ